MLAIDVHFEKELLVTSDEDGLIKIWDFDKKLIREIKFTEPVNVICFMNAEADLMAGHGGKLSKIKDEDYLPKEWYAKKKMLADEA